MTYSLYDAAVTPCRQQLGALVGIIDKAAAHCAANKIEESALLQEPAVSGHVLPRPPDPAVGGFRYDIGARLAGDTPPALPAVDDTSFADAKKRVETALGFAELPDPRPSRWRGGTRPSAWTAAAASGR